MLWPASLPRATPVPSLSAVGKTDPAGGSDETRFAHSEVETYLGFEGMRAFNTDGVSGACGREWSRENTLHTYRWWVRAHPRLMRES